MSKIKQLGDLQIAIMRALWDLGEGTVTQVRAALTNERDLAPTTVATVLSRLEKSGLVTHHTESRQFVYRPLLSKTELLRLMVTDLVEKLFQGDQTALVSHLLRESEISPGDLKRVKAMIAAKERQENRRG
jgi:predicted transcriptional regulator